MNEEEKNVYKCLFEYPTKKIANLEIENLKLEKELDQYKNNWEELRKAVKQIEKDVCDGITDEHLTTLEMTKIFLNKMKELEEGK